MARGDAQFDDGGQGVSATLEFPVDGGLNLTQYHVVRHDDGAWAHLVGTVGTVDDAGLVEVSRVIKTWAPPAAK